MAAERNNFKELYREEEIRFEQKQKEKDDLASGLWRTLGFFKLIGQVVDVFIPKIFELIIVALGGDMQRLEERKLHGSPPSQGRESDPRQMEPSDPGDDSPRGPEIV